MSKLLESSLSGVELQLKLQASIRLAQIKSRASKEWFILNIFAASFDKFVAGEYIRAVAQHLENDYTMDVTGRDHFKSTRLYADIMWALFTQTDKGFEAHYFSYAHSLAAYHMVKVKEMISTNPWFCFYKDHKTTAESTLHYSYLGGSKMTVHPGGLMSFKRGIHADRIYIDDPFRDPENKLKPLLILKINRTMKTEVLRMVNKGGVCRIVGTPQTTEDFFFDKEMQKTFKTWITPAIQDRANQVALWPEWYSFQELLEMERQMGEKIFAQEMMASPVYSEDSYLPKDQLMKCVGKDRTSLRLEYYPELKDKMVVAGLDIGKKVHPSHLAVFVKEQYEEIIYYKQIYSMWMDGWDYRKQVEFLNEAIECFNISKLRYDNTRGEFEGFNEQGLLNKVFKPVTLGTKNQTSMAANLGSIVDGERVEFINEARMLNQMLSMNNDLDAITGPEGHADSFWSVALALWEEQTRVPNIRTL